MNSISKKREYLAMSGLLMAALIWGFAFIVVKSSVDTIPSAYMLAFRFTIASIGLCVIFHKKLKLINKEAIKYSVLLGGLSTMLGYLLQNVGQKYTEPSTTALLLSMESVFGVVFSSIFLKEVLTPKTLLGCVIIFVAVIMAETKFDFIRKKKTEVNDIEEEFGETVS